ncbi:MAG: serine hydrolase domain-containing protein [Bacteroidota bacterium]|nr:serine hydrolase domain-containing protein [Bacteroidota bacterium]
MKKSLLLSALFLLLFVFANSAKAQNDSKEKYLKSLNIFIDGYNKQDYSLVKKPFSGLVKMLLHKGELKLNLEARYKEYGKIIRAENIYPSEGVLILPVIYEKDTTGIEYLSLFFTKKRKIQGFYFSYDNIVYPKITDSTTIKDITNPYLSFKHHKDIDVSLVVGVYENGKETIFCYGETAKGSGIKPDSNTLFQIGSITKVFTGILLANCINQNIVDASSLLYKFLPDSVPPLTYRGKEITLLDLATHTSALPGEPNNLYLPNTNKYNPFASYQEADLLTYLKHLELTRPVGKTYEYSNTGYGLLGYILAKQRKTSYDELLVKEICNKLNMNNTRTILNEEQNKRKVVGYFQGKQTPDFTFTPTFVGVGSIYSDVADMFKFIKANLKPEQTAIAKDIMLAQQPHQIDKTITMGMPWDIDSLTRYKVNVLGYSGNTAGASSVIKIVKEKNIGVVVLSNSNVPVDDIGLLVLKLLLKNQMPE